METIRIISAVEGNQDTINGKTITIARQTTTDVDIDFWIGFKEKHKHNTMLGHIYPEDTEQELAAIVSYRQKCFSRFEQEGEVKVEMMVNDPSIRRVKDVDVLFAEEWLAIKKQDKEAKTLALAESANNIAKESLLTAKKALNVQNRWGMWPVIISIIALGFIVKDDLISLFFR